jgi:hypothetical protein
MICCYLIAAALPCFLPRLKERGTDLVLALKIILGDELLQVIDMLPFEAPNFFRSEKTCIIYLNSTLIVLFLPIMSKFSSNLENIVFEVCSGKNS